ncbi:MAG TPA: lysylphosphatidylglycerol synthase transmembrane domain-containing protein [Gemmatimonadales bacterium]|nr:lysylphosphatidylglycerol synthase transmembrane domain-containing protein [Gemmatimonadales bacterium]
MTSWRFWLRAVVGLGLLAWIIGRTDLHALTIRVGPGLLLGVVGAVTAIAVAQGLAAWRWRVIIGPGAPPWGYLYRLYLIGLFFSLFLPTSIGGDTVRAAAASAGSVNPGSAVASVLLDRIVVVIALVFYFMLGVLLDPGAFTHLAGEIGVRMPGGAKLAAGGFGLLVILVGLVVLGRRSAGVRRAIDEGKRLTLLFARSPGALGRALGLGLAVQGVYILAWGALAAGLGWSLPLGFLLFAVPFVSLAAMAPVTISGLGVREGAWLLLLAPRGIPGPDAVAYGLLYFLSVMIVAASGGLLFTVRGVAVPERGFA